jgi:hypothetical protein
MTLVSPSGPVAEFLLHIDEVEAWFGGATSRSRGSDAARVRSSVMGLLGRVPGSGQVAEPAKERGVLLA